MKHFSLLLLICGITLFAQSEEELVQTALKHSYGIRLSRIDVAQDSIRLVKRQDELKPKITLDLGGEIVPWDSTDNGLTSYSSKGIYGKTGVKISKDFVSGGELSGSASLDGDKDFESDNKHGGSNLSLSYAQPLLKNGLKRSYHRFYVHHDELTLTQEKLRLKSKIIEALSDVRATLLTLQSKEKQIETILFRKKQAQRKHAENLKRFEAGVLGHIDTLHSQLTLVRVEQDLYRAESELAESRSYITYLCGDRVTEPVDMRESTFRFPRGDLLLTKAIAHPSISILDVIDSALAVSIAHREQEKLPSLDIYATLERRGSGDHPFDESYSKRKLALGVNGSFSLPFRNIRHEIALLKRSRESQALQKGERKAFLTFEIERLELLWKREQALLKLRKQEKEVSVALFEALQKASDVGAVSRSEYYTAEEDAYNAALAVDSQELLLHTITVSLEKITGEVLQRYGVKL